MGSPLMPRYIISAVLLSLAPPAVLILLVLTLMKVGR